jgi:hypothetical protein
MKSPKMPVPAALGALKAATPGQRVQHPQLARLRRALRLLTLER